MVSLRNPPYEGNVESLHEDQKTESFSFKFGSGDTFLPEDIVGRLNNFILFLDLPIESKRE